MSFKNKTSDIGLRIEPINQSEDVIEAFDCVCEAFGRQAQDGVWIAMTPGWETPAGRSLGAARMVARWRNTTRDKSGRPNTIFLKATLPCPHQQDKRIIAGFAIWVQASSVAGFGNPAVREEELCDDMNLEEIYPGNEPEQRYLSQTVASLHRQRAEVIKEKSTADPPAVMILDMCAVDPAHQRKGIARALVQWGLNEAQRRGDLESITEASAMGRYVYGQMGFVPQGAEIEYLVDEEFASRSRPSNIFMRTQGSLV
jgi:GNAT superfamily N-acetyltransferase